MTEVKLINVHAEGEIGYVAYAGVPDIPGASLADKLAYLNFLDAKFFAALIMVVGVVGFIFKLLYWKFFSQTDAKTD